ncbi:MAG: BrnT family toxin [Melioribacteraceae bacterium]|nr:BrnT family toxin [Melioribacteraceae bacterium]WKZ69370.1 MAG: BrnT family toxin [Melioribacteraceae bacterium]
MEKSASFEWDEEKNRLNKEKHNVSFEVAQFAFLDNKRVIAKDLEHSKGEERFYCFGKIGREIVTVRFTYRSKRIRIIGAGYWRKGKKIYEKENKI